MKYIVLLSAVLMQMCLGATYSWSIYVQPLKELTGMQQGPVQIPFTVFYFAFPLSMLIAGSLLPKIGTRRSAMIGGLFFGGGWLVAGMGAENFIFTILGIGLLSGIGAGMAYIVPIAVCIRWFPRNKGMVTGIAVAGFGGGAALVSQVGGWCMSSLGYSPFQTFVLFGGIFMATVFTAGATMKLPGGQEQKHPPRLVPLREFLVNPSFQILYIAMFAGLSAGFAINANLKELYGGSGDAVTIGISAVSLFALANAVGRVTWGAIFDRISSSTAIQINLFFQAVVVGVAPFCLQSAIGFWFVAVLIGFNFGGVLVIYVSSATRLWGTENVGQVYGWLFSSNIPASISPILAGMIFDRFHTFNPALALSAVLLIFCGLFIGSRKRIVNSPPSAC